MLAGKYLYLSVMPPALSTTAVAAPLDAETPARLRAVVGKLSRRLNSLARGSGLTPSQLSALGVVARQGPLRLSELAEIESVNPTMLSRVVAALDEAGLVRRRTDPDDRAPGCSRSRQAAGVPTTGCGPSAAAC